MVPLIENVFGEICASFLLQCEMQLLFPTAVPLILLDTVLPLPVRGSVQARFYSLVPCYARTRIDEIIRREIGLRVHSCSAENNIALAHRTSRIG